jgi:hypothetical protein
MADRPFTRVEDTDAYGKPITIYRSLDSKLTVELQYPLDGGYWWTKVKHVYGHGNDGAFNFPDKACMVLAAIFKDIDRRNKKIGKGNDQ